MKHDVCHNATMTGFVCKCGATPTGDLQQFGIDHRPPGFEFYKDLENAKIYSNGDEFITILPDWPIPQQAYTLREAENFARGMR